MASPRCADDHERRRCGFSALELTPATQKILSDYSIRPFTNGSPLTRVEGLHFRSRIVVRCQEDRPCLPSKA
jgi:hypothetical protein